MPLALSHKSLPLILLYRVLSFVFKGTEVLSGRLFLSKFIGMRASLVFVSASSMSRLKYVLQRQKKLAINQTVSYPYHCFSSEKGLCVWASTYQWLACVLHYLCIVNSAFYHQSSWYQNTTYGITGRIFGTHIYHVETLSHWRPTTFLRSEHLS